MLRCPGLNKKGARHNQAAHFPIDVGEPTPAHWRAILPVPIFVDPIEPLPTDEFAVIMAPARALLEVLDHHQVIAVAHARAEEDGLLIRRHTQA
jgi:hypothetical protein